MLMNEPLTSCKAYLQSLEGSGPMVNLGQFERELLPDSPDAATRSMFPYSPVPLAVYLKDMNNVMLAVAIHKSLLDLDRDVSHWGNPGVR